MRSFWPTVMILPLCWVGTAHAQRAPETTSESAREVEVEPRGEVGTQAPDGDGAGADGGGVTIGEPQTIGRPEAIGSPQVIGTPQAIGGDRAGGEFAESEVQSDTAGGFGGTPPDGQGADAYGAVGAQSGTGGSEQWIPGQDDVGAPPPAESYDDSSATGSLQMQPDDAPQEAAPMDGLQGEQDAGDPSATGWTQPGADEEAWGGTGWMEQERDEPDAQEPGVGGSGAADETGTWPYPSDPPEVQEPGAGGSGDGAEAAEGGSAGGELLSPGLVFGPTDPQTGALIDPSTGQPQLAQSPPGTGAPQGQATPQGVDASGAGPAERDPQASREAPLEDALDSLTEANEESVELQEAQLDVLETQLAQQEAAEARRLQEAQAESLAMQQRLTAARLLEQGELALDEGDTDLTDELADARGVLVEELAVARSSGHHARLRELSLALDRLDAAVLAADSNNGLEARRWLYQAREVLVGPGATSGRVEEAEVSPW